jgi:beta-galactosidase
MTILELDYTKIKKHIEISDAMKKYTNILHFGAAYYPERWPEDRWSEDIGLMVEAGFTVVRMGEFAWSTFETKETEFHFGWLHRAIGLLAEHGILTVFCTPTAAPPVWLTQKNPSTLAVDENGKRYKYGKRYHYCVNSLEYHQHTRRIVEAIAEYFGGNPNILGWQIDNEFRTVCYCDTCRSVFQAFLAEKFESLEALNDHWATRYWSQTYSSWDQIPIPKPGHNPGLMLSFQQFVTHSYKKYQKLQADILRPHLQKGVWVTHNFMKWFPKYDHYEMSEDLDLASWDWYVPDSHPDYTETGAAHDLVRGFKRRNFWLMETQPANVNWTLISNRVNKWACRAMAWHAVGHGADALLYWQWRSALNGQEQYHGSLVDHSGQPRPFYDEAVQIGSQFKKVSDLLAGSRVQARVAILNDYNSRGSLDWSRQHEDFDYVEHLLHYYKPLAARNIPVDIISADEPLGGYYIVIVPSLIILTPDRVEKMEKFMGRSGHLILTIRTGMKDHYNSLLPTRQPGPLAAFTNIEVEEYYPLDNPIPVVGNIFGEGVSKIWAERLRIIDKEKHTSVVARFGRGNGWLDDQIAISFNAFGLGGAYYVGAYLDDESQSKMLKYICDLHSVKPVLETPEGVEACQRITRYNQKVFILINHTRTQKDVDIPWVAQEQLTGATGQGSLSLAPYGVAVLTK